MPSHPTNNDNGDRRVVHVVLVRVDTVLDHLDFVEGGELGHREDQNEGIALADQPIDGAVEIIDSLKIAEANFVLLILEFVSNVLDFHQSRDVLVDELLVANAADDRGLSWLGYRLRILRAGEF